METGTSQPSASWATTARDVVHPQGWSAPHAAIPPSGAPAYPDSGYGGGYGGAYGNGFGGGGYQPQGGYYMQQRAPADKASIDGKTVYMFGTGADRMKKTEGKLILCGQSGEIKIEVPNYDPLTAAEFAQLAKHKWKRPRQSIKLGIHACLTYIYACMHTCIHPCIQYTPYRE